MSFIAGSNEPTWSCNHLARGSTTFFGLGVDPSEAGGEPKVSKSRSSDALPAPRDFFVPSLFFRKRPRFLVKYFCRKGKRGTYAPLLLYATVRTQ